MRGDRKSASSRRRLHPSTPPWTRHAVPRRVNIDVFCILTRPVGRVTGGHRRPMTTKEKLRQANLPEFAN